MLFNTFIIYVSKCCVAVSLVALAMLTIPVVEHSIVLLMTVLTVLVLTNAMMYLAFYKDKSYAQSNKQRVSEKTLILLSMLALHCTTHLTMHFTQHKTSKWSFQLKLLLAILLQLSASTVGFVQIYM
ncbi:DUF1294 domain-containing protein [Pseudoalteromonas luteoviolacea]|uniref:DUF1294 domain-containing protein n=1 Tax=Pseudoalteromonas luteoviolacea S4054 TaxID=1129367 RepID=A0A0F6A7Y8_9GAMM|nr:DUF1294 domain-containing protein [Pseudoalteromonas luteoviolacea]AOT07832.1 hypothetical protein S4054249_08250 [Pseudoalteromonas luteoviolacea]AOT12748.1 hypothetical protein S40542_08250 [Pseudoalteromonas luteoviolacea]AOT17661.1 hypothetical protein S4054_08245 [Pseudoalteromonas luteoviolacea]KKE82322.1 hypothetical protein N479_18965 [Pseudoalteromonas luteoviolacea S4054]KZN78974.1 hypothetical protein N481_00595 [Pseudoalteromonas luteoviolacea S4047-1]